MQPFYRKRLVPGKVCGELVEDEDLLVERTSQSFVGQTHEFGLVGRKTRAVIQLVCGDDVSTLPVPLTGCRRRFPEEFVEALGEALTWDDVDVRQEDVGALAVAASQVPHVVLRVRSLQTPPTGEITWLTKGQTANNSFYKSSTVQITYSSQS